MQKVFCDSNKSNLSPSSADFPMTVSIVDCKVQDVVTPTLEGLVSNLQNLSFQWHTNIPGVIKELSPDFAIKNSMNLIPLPSLKANSQQTDPTIFFQQLGCTPPASCTKAHVQDFYKLLSSSLLTNQMSLKEFLDFDVYCHLKKIHNNSSPDLKRKMEVMLQKWCAIFTKSKHLVNNSLSLMPYFKEVCLFHKEIHELLKIAPSGDKENLEKSYLFPSVILKLDQNYHFFLQFISTQNHFLLTDKLLTNLTGTSQLIPSDSSQTSKILRNLENYAEFLINSKILDGECKDKTLLKKMLSELKILTNSFNAQSSPDAFVSFVRQYNGKVLELIDKVYVSVGMQGLFYKQHAGCTSMFFIASEFAASSEKKISEAKELLSFAQNILDVTSLIETSVLPIIIPKFKGFDLYNRRFELILRSVFGELESLKKPGLNLTDLSNKLKKDDSKSLESFIERLRLDFYQKMFTSDFYDRIGDYLESRGPDSQPTITMFAINKLYQILKPLTEKMIESIEKECAERSLQEFETISLFNKTEWLAKALLLSHDMGILLLDPNVYQEIDFDHNYMNLINRYDPSVISQTKKITEESEVEIHLVTDGENSNDRENAPEIKTDRQLPSVVKKTVRLSPRAPLGSLSTAPQTEKRNRAPIDRKELREGINKTKGDPRKLSKFLLNHLGWGLVHDGKKHPTIKDTHGRPIAPMPSAGHAAVGTVLNIANRVCDAAQEQGLLSSD